MKSMKPRQDEVAKVSQLLVIKRHRIKARLLQNLVGKVFPLLPRLAIAVPLGNVVQTENPSSFITSRTITARFFFVAPMNTLPLHSAILKPRQPRAGQLSAATYQSPASRLLATQKFQGVLVPSLGCCVDQLHGLGNIALDALAVKQRQPILIVSRRVPAR